MARSAHIMHRLWGFFKGDRSQQVEVISNRLPFQLKWGLLLGLKGVLAWPLTYNFCLNYINTIHYIYPFLQTEKYYYVWKNYIIIYLLVKGDVITAPKATALYVCYTTGQNEIPVYIWFTLVLLKFLNLDKTFCSWKVICI